MLKNIYVSFLKRRNVVLKEISLLQEDLILLKDGWKKTMQLSPEVVKKISVGDKSAVGNVTSHYNTVVRKGLETFSEFETRIIVLKLELKKIEKFIAIGKALRQKKKLKK